MLKMLSIFHKKIKKHARKIISTVGDFFKKNMRGKNCQKKGAILKNGFKKPCKKKTQSIKKIALSRIGSIDFLPPTTWLLFHHIFSCIDKSKKKRTFEKKTSKKTREKIIVKKGKKTHEKRKAKRGENYGFRCK